MIAFATVMPALVAGIHVFLSTVLPSPKRRRTGMTGTPAHGCGEAFNILSETCSRMISVILIGRNDDYEGDFRHRVVLSINVLAEQLKNTDEIIFVDWNSPQGAGTLPQAIAGSLTQQATALTRTIEVGGGIHAEFARRGAFAAIVPVVAYNAAIRRADPSSKWILITTSDMLLVSRDTGRTLSDVAAGLPDGVYGLPRFELPRWVWQGLDPCDPSAAATCLSKFGKCLHLEEAVRLPPPVLFDSPGDFQLVLRADLLAIDGLDEGMSMGALGPDSNLLKRLELWGRRTVSLERHFAGYHCNHTSSAGSSHRTGRVENDTGLFVEEVARADLPFQRCSWGLADRALPEIKLSAYAAPTATKPNRCAAHRERIQRMAARLAAVIDAIGPAQTGLYDTTPLFNRVGYPTRHVIAFLLDHVFAEAGPISYVGANELAASLLAAVLQRLEPHRSLVGFRPEDRAGFEQCYYGVGGSGTQALLIFDFGIDCGKTNNNPSIQACSESIRRLLWEIRDRFMWCVEQERRRRRTQGNAIRIVAINTINTEFEQLILTSLDCRLSPFITRTRSGRVRAELPVPVVSHPAADHMARRLGRRRGVHVGEFARAWAIAQRLAWDAPAAQLASAWLTPSVDALLDWPGISSAIGVNNHRIAEVKSQVAARRAALPKPARRPNGNGAVLASKLASAQDWEIPEWYELAHWYLGSHHSYNVFQRHRRDWENIHFLFCLRRFGILDTDAEVVVLSHTPDRFAFTLARRVRKVHLVNSGWKSNDRFLRVPELRLDCSIRVYKGLSDPAFRDIAAAALIAQSHNPRPFALSGLRHACRAVSADGILGLSFDVCVPPTKGRGLSRWLHPLPDVDDLENGSIRCWAGLPPEFKPIPSDDWSLDPESFALVAPPAGWRWRQMTAKRHGQHITSAIRWFRRSRVPEG